MTVFALLLEIGDIPSMAEMVINPTNPFCIIHSGRSLFLSTGKRANQIAKMKLLGARPWKSDGDSTNSAHVQGP